MSQTFNFKREKEILDLINVYRKEKNLQPYIWHDFMGNLARYHSQSMAEKRVQFSHQAIEDRLKQIKESVPEGKVYYGGSENVAYSRPGDMNPINSWQKSKGHDKNLLGDFTHCGIGYVVNDNHEHYYTALFAKISDIKNYKKVQN